MADFLFLSEHQTRFSISAFLRTRFPQLCVLCNQRTDTDCLCSACVAEWHFHYQKVHWRCHQCKVAQLGGECRALSTLCSSCVSAPPAWQQICIAFDYAAPWDSLIWRYKERHQLRLVPILGQLLLFAAQRDQLILPVNTLVTYIPSRAAAIRQRGFNPAAELARFIAFHLRLKVAHGLLVLADDKSDNAQKHRSLQQRKQHAQQAFRWNGRTAPRSVLLIDDVLTSGSTMQSATQCLLTHGVSQVSAFALARAPWSR